MWLEIFDLFNIIAVIFCAIAIKMADDFLDYDLDKASGNQNLGEILGPGLSIYAMLFLSLSVYINPPLCLSLFLASYCIGMFHDLKQRFPSGLTGLQESIVVNFIGFWLCGWRYMIFSIMFALAIQLIDDCIDAKKDTYCGYRNLAHRFGIIECCIFAVISLLLAWLVGKSLFFSVLISILIFYIGLFWYQGVQKSD